MPAEAIGSARWSIIGLHRIYESYQSPARDRPGPPLQLTLPPLTGHGLFGAWINFIKEWIRMRRACRTSFADPLDFTVRLIRVNVGQGALDAGRSFAREQ